MHTPRPLAQVVAPVLRLLLGGPEAPGIVCSEASSRVVAEAAQLATTAPAVVGCELDEEDPPAAVLAKLRRAVGGAPGAHTVVVPTCGVFAAGPSAAIARERLAAAVGRARTAADTATHEAPARLAGRVALVTGAARGLGYDLCGALADAGCHVMLADVDATGVAAARDRLVAGRAPDVAAAVHLDVTDESSVARGVAVTVATFGGLDIVVSNAGVLRAGSVKVQTVSDFDLVTSVNYRGFFLVVKHTASVLALQHEVNAAYVSDIIQINSKSGLVGSNRNGAYAGGKFGGVGLTQSFALELIDDGIKVNAICPGNLFDGPLWSDPKEGLFAQYLRENKVPGAKTPADVRRAYEAKVPMRRGCQSADVARALLYAIEQRYETGQAIPVTGGQVMLG